MSPDWPPLSDFDATVGRLATAEDTRANRAVFRLEYDGQRIGVPIDMPLPCYAWAIDRNTGVRRRCVIIQAEEAGPKRYLGAWLLDKNQPHMGFESEFEILAP